MQHRYKLQQMKTLNESDYNQLINGAKILEVDGDEGKVFLTTDQHILKCFRAKKDRSWASDLIAPHEKRFIKNAGCLIARGFKTITVTELFYFPHQTRYAVLYPCLPGETVRDRLRQGDTTVLDRLPDYLAALHKKGVYFRSLHLGNVLCQENNEFALIDIVDVRFQAMSLNPIKRARNFRHVLRYAADLQSLEDYGINKFINHYCQASEFSSIGKFVFMTLFTNLLEKFRQKKGTKS
jgi:tRNA A-37 threonylcarbamoyl transferase component Bud32